MKFCARIVSVVLLASMLLSAVACGNSGTEEQSNATTTQAAV